ncbi:MAG: hypothetical protein JWO98_3692 [Frankiales bacterium]|nr:hypothetical protein [Frankiales bacterium]
MTDIEALKPLVGSYVAVVFRVDGYDPDVGETQETATMARLVNVGVDGEETGWEENCIGLYSTSARVVSNPRDVLTDAASGEQPDPRSET